MTDMPAGGHARRALADRVPLAALIALAGAALYAVLMARSVWLLPGAAFGADIYDQYWLAILDGRLDLPARVVRVEGHYAPDGTAYVYHGVAPLLTRALLDPFVTMGAVSLAPVSIWLWAVAGTACWQAAFHGALASAGADRALAVRVGAALWLCGPGVLLVANHAFYHEPIAVAYALSGAFVLIWANAAQRGPMTAAALVVLAALAAASVHARPHVAVGLYLATGLAAVRMLWQVGRRALPAALVAGLVLGAGGAGYLALNEARFGEATSVHGSFEAEGVQYGMAFWGVEEPGNARQTGFIEHGRFNPGRILPNGALYLAAPPEHLFPTASTLALVAHWHATVPRVGFVRVEGLSVGILFLWTLWTVLAVVGLRTLWREGRPYAALIAGLGVTALLLMSYATITLRYVVDLWPIVAVLALFGARALPARMSYPRARTVLGVAAVLGIMVTAHVAALYPMSFRVGPEGAAAEWTEQECRAGAEARGLPADRIGYVCRDPMIETRG